MSLSPTARAENLNVAILLLWRTRFAGWIVTSVRRAMAKVSDPIFVDDLLEIATSISPPSRVCY